MHSIYYFNCVLTPQCLSSRVWSSLTNRWQSFTNPFVPGERFSVTIPITPSIWRIYSSTLLVTVTHGFRSTTKVIVHRDLVVVTSLIFRNTTLCLTWVAKVGPRKVGKSGNSCIFITLKPSHLQRHYSLETLTRHRQLSWEDSSLCFKPSPRAHLHVIGMLRFMLWHKPAELAHSLLFRSCVYFCLCGPFNCISFHKFSRQLSAFSLCSCNLISAFLVLSTAYLFVKVSFSPDIIFCGWLGLKHQLTDSHGSSWHHQLTLPHLRHLTSRHQRSHVGQPSFVPL